MSDIDDDDDYIDDYEGDLDWLYVEEHYDEADDLAEHACPSPALDYIDPSADYDPYSYFEDITYLSDGFYDAEPEEHARPAKRKRPSESHRPAATKRPRAARDPPVLWRPRNDDRTATTIGAPTIPAAAGARMPSVALFRDWRAAPAPAPAADIPDADADADAPQEADAFDVDDLSALLGLMSQADVDRVRATLREKGLGDDALELVLQDLKEGTQREFDDDGDDDDDDADGADNAAGSGDAGAGGAGSGGGGGGGPAAADADMPDPDPPAAPRPPKRKRGPLAHADADDDADADAGDAAGSRRVARGKRARPAPDVPADPAAALGGSSRVTRSARARRRA